MNLAAKINDNEGLARNNDHGPRITIDVSSKSTYTKFQ